MKNFKWIAGRQKGTEYRKMLIYSFRLWKFGFDMYLLKYNADTLLGWHTDPVEDGKHWRMNIKLKGKATFQICMEEENELVSTTKMVNLFRADLNQHMLRVKTPTTKLSLGFVKFE